MTNPDSYLIFFYSDEQYEVKKFLLKQVNLTLKYLDKLRVKATEDLRGQWKVLNKVSSVI